MDYYEISTSHQTWENSKCRPLTRITAYECVMNDISAIQDAFKTHFFQHLNESRGHLNLGRSIRVTGQPFFVI